MIHRSCDLCGADLPEDDRNAWNTSEIGIAKLRVVGFSIRDDGEFASARHLYPDDIDLCIDNGDDEHPSCLERAIDAIRSLRGDAVKLDSIPVADG